MLSGKQRRFLRAMGHHKDPIVQVGKDGISEGLLSALDVALDTHELVKVKLGDSAGADRRALGAAIAEAAGGELVQVLGRTVLVYRRRKKDPEIVLPH
ncbi:MAG TPA: ribosome assembly RNA-binding protein YhbY [Polyangia bacterium]